LGETCRLTAILAADVAGYSRLMGADEENAALSLPLVFDPGEKWDYGINIHGARLAGLYVGAF
jgi:hypothetical protein